MFRLRWWSIADSLRILGDFVRDGQRAVSRRAIGVDGVLGDALAIPVREFFEQLTILHQQRGRAGRR